jgi:hypothetical protein
MTYLFIIGTQHTTKNYKKKNLNMYTQMLGEFVGKMSR